MGLVIVANRKGKHGRVRSRRLALRQVRERARSKRQAQYRVVAELTPRSAADGTWDVVSQFMKPVSPSGRVIR